MSDSDDEYDDDGEFLGLVSAERRNTNTSILQQVQKELSINIPDYVIHLAASICTVISLGCLILFVVPFWLHYSQHFRHMGNNIVQYECPATFEKSASDELNPLTPYEWNNTLSKNSSAYHDNRYDGGDMTYDVKKESLRAFKAKYFGDDLKSGHSIYESACGNGFSLLMTSEILEEELGIHSLTLYGNDYASESIERTKQVLGSLASHGTKGARFCAGDSTNLTFVPSRSFDLVYTGSIHPTIDPLNLMDIAPKSMKNHKQMFKSLCKSDDWTAKKLVELDQRAQEDWYASWVSEMVRIAKAGKFVVAMDVSFPQCEDLNALGGVSKEWWAGATINMVGTWIPHHL
eukprot:scaffold479533_cov130-Attheya_sp.AAC.1